jgi:hypothetical protein
MMTAFRLMRLHLALYLRTSRFVMQLTATILFVAALYSTAPAEAVGDFTLSEMALFFIMVWAGFGMADDPALEQLLAIKVRSAAKRHLGDALSLLVISMLFGAIAVAYPAAENFFMRGGLYKLPLTAMGAALAFALQTSAALLGGVTGWFFHPRVVGDRKLSALVALLISILGLVKPGLISVWPPLTAAGWLFPPLSDVALRLSGKTAFTPSDVSWCCGALLAYACALILLRWIILVKRKY